MRATSCEKLRKIRVLHVISNFGVGGAEVWLLALLRHFRDCTEQRSIQVESHVFLTHGVTDVLDEQARALGAQLYYSKYGRATWSRFVRDWRNCLSIGRYDAIHDHQESTAGFHLLMGLGLLPRTRVVHLHNPLTHEAAYSSSVTRALTVRIGKRLVGHFATHCLSTSAQLIVQQGFADAKYNGLHREAVHCGFAVERFRRDHLRSHSELCCELEFPNDARIILFVGRLESHREERLNQKNPSFFLEVVRKCMEQDEKIFCVLAGGGDRMRGHLEDRVRSWGLARRIRFLGRRSDVPYLMSAAHILILPSLAEGLGMVAVEAQAAGLPVIASTAVPKECAVVPGLVEFCDLAAGPDDWASKVTRVVKSERPNADLANSIVAKSRYAIEASASRLVEIYTSGISGYR